MNLGGHLLQHRLSGATRQLTWDLIRARRQAITLRQPVHVTFGETHTYAIWIDTNKNGVTESGEAEMQNLHTRYPAVTVTATSHITFNSRGASTTGATITLTNAHGSKHITVNIAGYIKSG